VDCPGHADYIKNMITGTHTLFTSDKYWLKTYYNNIRNEEIIQLQPII
jgi:sulfate adenylyltransferase subunit 1 (EFTu-like GTPase family)